MNKKELGVIELTKQPEPSMLRRWRSLAYRMARGISCRMLAVVVLLASVLSIGLSVSSTSDPVAAENPVSCAAGTFYFGGGCVPCEYNPSQCPPPVENPTTPNIQNQERQGADNPQEHRVHVNTISRNEAPNFNLGVPDRSQETNKVCTVNGAPAYSITPEGSAAGVCSRNAEKYFDASASCPAGTHPRVKGDSGQYWCDSDRTDYVINDQVIGHTVCMLGAIRITDEGLCHYCPKVNSSGFPLDRALSEAKQRCHYTTPPTTTQATTTSTTFTSATSTTANITVPSSPSSTTTSAPAPTTVAPVPTTIAPVSPTTAPAPAPPDPAPPQPESGQPAIPNVALRWSPQSAITQIPLFVWLEITSGSAQQIWTDAFGRTYSSELAVETTTWSFEVVDGRGRSWTDSVTCQGAGQPWRAAWIDSDGNPTPTARSDGACWYIYRHMGDGSPRQVNVKIVWAVKSCQTLPAAGPCETTEHEQTMQSSISVSEIQAIIN